MASRLFSARRLCKSSYPSSFSALFRRSRLLKGQSPTRLLVRSDYGFSPSSPFSRSFGSLPLDHGDSQSLSGIDYRSLLQEDEYQRLAEVTMNDLQEKIEEYGDNIQIEGFDIDYGNDVLTIKLGDLGTYVLNKQTPNRQIWLSSPVSGPSRYDWDKSIQAWIYRRTRVKLYDLLKDELTKLCGEPIHL